MQLFLSNKIMYILERMSKNYIQLITSYLRSQEKRKDNLRLGLEIEHFVLWRDTRKSVTYGEEGGIAELLSWFKDLGWEGHYEGKSLIGLSRGQQAISLEPGAQLEFSSSPGRDIETLREEYGSFFSNLQLWTEQNGQSVENCAYQPVSSISEIPLIPKRKYHIMDRYFRDRGKLAHNMMRGTGSTQLTIDYTDENDFLRKLRLAARTAPVFTILFSNCCSFEGVPYTGHSLRSEIWQACDDDRCGILPGIFKEDYGYERFAEYLLGLKPIVYYRDGEYMDAETKTFQAMLTEYPPENFTATLSEALRMVFTDVRVKQFLEFRMVDSLPPDEIWMYASLVKSIFYQPENMKRAELLFQGIGAEDIAAVMSELPSKGYSAVLGDRELSEYIFPLVDIAAGSPLPDTAGHLDVLYHKLRKETCGEAVCM